MLPPSYFLYDIIGYTANQHGSSGLDSLDVKHEHDSSIANAYPMSEGANCSTKSDLPYTITLAIREFCITPGIRTSCPLLEYNPVPAPTDVVINLNALPLSDAVHENKQLVWGRTNNNIPLRVCSSDKTCYAHRLPGNIGPLCVYLTVDEQDEYDKSGYVPPTALFCLLCIRRRVSGENIMYKNSIINPLLQCGRGLFNDPPFQNPINVPGGYIESAFGVRADKSLCIATNIVTRMDTLIVKHDPYDDKRYIDQGGIIYGACASLNGQATTM